MEIRWTNQSTPDHAKSNFPDQSEIPCPGRKIGFYSFYWSMEITWHLSSGVNQSEHSRSCKSNFPDQSEIPCHVASKKFARARAWRSFVSRNPRVKFSEKKKKQTHSGENECMFFFERRIFSRTALRVSSFFLNVLLNQNGWWSFTAKKNFSTSRLDV